MLVVTDARNGSSDCLAIVPTVAASFSTAFLVATKLAAREMFTKGELEYGATIPHDVFVMPRLCGKKVSDSAGQMTEQRQTGQPVAGS